MRGGWGPKLPSFALCTWDINPLAADTGEWEFAAWWGQGRGLIIPGWQYGAREDIWAPGLMRKDQQELNS